MANMQLYKPDPVTVLCTMGSAGFLAKRMKGERGTSRFDHLPFAIFDSPILGVSLQNILPKFRMLQHDLLPLPRL